MNVSKIGLFGRCMIKQFSKSLSTQPPLTTERYNIKRGDYASLTNDDIIFFKSILTEPSMVLENADDIVFYNVDWLGIFRGESRLVLRPKSTEQVSKILQYCNSKKLAVVPQGGNTGLVGGSVPVFDEIVLSTQLMDKIINLDSTSGILVCQSGCVMEKINQYLDDSQLMLPLDLGSKGSCNIGGNLSTNAGGMRLLRYGSLHGSTIGLEAVTANGSIIDCLSTMRKDNVGYHMKHMFIGSEGTLGIITKASILCSKKLPSVNLALLGCPSFDDVLKILDLAREDLSEILSAFEFMDQASISCSEKYLKSKCPIQGSPFYVVVETSGSDADHDREKLNKFFEKSVGSGIVTDGTLAHDMSKIENLWKFRETIALGLTTDGHCYKYDVSLPLSKFYDVVEHARSLLAGRATTICGYGHVGDGNLHFNVTSPTYDKSISETIDDFLYDFVISNKGSISAEHGVGIFKRDHIQQVKTPESLQMMRQLKHMMDPQNILNPYKVLP